LLGKALWEGILVEPRFAHFVLRKMLGRANTADDLASYDAQLYRHLMSFRRYDGDVEDLGLTFSVADRNEITDAVEVVPLIPRGTEIAVASKEDDIPRYIALLAGYRLNKQIQPQVKAFLRGFRQLVPITWMRMFGPSELQTLLGGSEDRGIDLADLRRNTQYGGGYSDSHPYIQGLWRVLASFEPADLRAFLCFTTSVSRPPLLGFGTLKPAFGIARVPINSDSDKLPMAATCMNLLKLPHYSSEQVLREKLLYAIHAGAGFELS
jgi:ubiquitin-protein ligase E3 C